MTKPEKYYIISESKHAETKFQDENFPKEFDCLFVCIRYLDSIAWENSITWEEYNNYTKHLDSGRIEIKGVIFTIISELQLKAKRRKQLKAA
jgi:hypothetical protein